MTIGRVKIGKAGWVLLAVGVWLSSGWGPDDCTPHNSPMVHAPIVQVGELSR